MFCKADFYDVSGSGSEWTATVFQGNNVIDKFEAVSEKQAHFLASEAYPEANTPSMQHQLFMKQFNSAEGHAYRAKQRRKNGNP